VHVKLFIDLSNRHGSLLVLIPLPEKLVLLFSSGVFESDPQSLQPFHMTDATLFSEFIPSDLST